MSTMPQALFVSKIDIPSADVCWNWKGPLSRSGYGVFAWAPKNRTGAHRYSWQFFHGKKIPEGKMVLHACNNPRCVNPTHLRIGTHLINMMDRRLSGNYKNGEDHPASVLTNALARRIFNDPRTCRVIAEQYGLKRDTVHRIRRGQTYAAATGGGVSPYQKSKGKGSWDNRVSGSAYR